MQKKRTYYTSKRKKLWYSYIAYLLDIFIDLFGLIFKKRYRGKTNTPSPYFLIASFGHLGDALILSYTLPIIKKQYPNSIIDIMIGDWCVPIFKNNPIIDDIIIINHFFTNRSKISYINKIFIHLKTSYQAFLKLRNKNYDYSIDIRYTTATSHYLTGISPIKKTVGYGSAVFGGLLDKELMLPNRNLHLIQIISNLLYEVGIYLHLDNIIPYLNVPTDVLITQAKFPELNLETENYFLIFPETGEPLRALSPNFWIKLIDYLCQKTPFRVIVCGQSEATEEWCENIRLTYPQKVIVKTKVLNMADLVLLSTYSRMAFTLESFPAHLCSIFTKTISFFKDGAGYTYFPIAKYDSVIFHNDESSISSPPLPNLTTIYCPQIEDSKTFEIVETILNTNVH